YEGAENPAGSRFSVGHVSWLSLPLIGALVGRRWRIDGRDGGRLWHGRRRKSLHVVNVAFSRRKRGGKLDDADDEKDDGPRVGPAEEPAAHFAKKEHATDGDENGGAHHAVDRATLATATISATHRDLLKRSSSSC